jgi:hypothetical protein
VDATKQPGRDLFLDHAAGILDTATACAGQQDWTILVGTDGQLEMLAANDWPLESLARERGSQMAFRVKHSDSTVHVEGRQGLRSCSFASEPAGAAMQRMLNGPGLYRLLA